MTPDDPTPLPPSIDPDDGLRSLLGAYALDALDEDERRRVDDLLARDPQARSELSDLSEAAALLALAAGEPARASDERSGELWRSIARELEREPSEVVSISARRRTKVSTVSAALAVAASIAVAVLALRVVELRDDLAAERSRTEAGVDMERVYTQAARLSEAREVVLARDEHAVAHLVMMPDGTGLVHNDALEPLSPGHTYQLWAVVGDPEDPTVISAGVLGSAPTVSAFTVSGPVVAFVITVEEGDGVVSSDEPAYAAVELTPA